MQTSNHFQSKDTGGVQIPLMDLTNTDSHDPPAEDLDNQRIETVLTKVNSSSWVFQIRTLAFFSFNFFNLGMHCYTFLFIFLSPGFVYRDQSGQCKPRA